MSLSIERLGESLRLRPGAPAELDGDPARAAVLLLLRGDRPEPELLLIRRAQREGDPWSGQVALPGGRWQPGDDSLQVTAVRETREETGLEAPLHSIIGVLDELRPRTPMLPPIVVTPFVAAVHAPGPLALNHEVADAFWVPWSHFLDPATDQVREVAVRGATWRVPTFAVGEHVVWGMTERILRQLITRTLEP